MKEKITVEISLDEVPKRLLRPKKLVVALHSGTVTIAEKGASEAEWQLSADSVLRESVHWAGDRGSAIDQLKEFRQKLDIFIGRLESRR